MSLTRNSRVRMLAAVVVAVGFIAITQGADQPAPKSQPAKPAAHASPKPATEGPSGTSAQTAVERALAAPAEFDFVDTLLPDAVRSIAESSKINVLLDQKNLTDAGITPCTTLTNSVSAVSLRSALHLTLSQKDIAFVTVSDNSIMVTTADVAKQIKTPRLYVVRDLIAQPVSQNEFVKPTPAPVDSLIELITSVVSPAFWDSNGGIGSIAYINGALVISQTDEIHRQIAALLADLRVVRDKQRNHANTTSTDLQSAAGPAEQRIRKALDTPLDFSFVDTPLKDIVRFLRSKLRVPVQMDAKSLTDAKVTPATTISFAAKQIRARDGLRQLLAAKELAYVIEDESLVITTADHAKLVVHPVVYGVGDLCGYYDSASDGGPDYDSLIEMLTSIVAPASWDANGGNGSIAPFPVANAIVCSQADENQEQIAKLLAQLRANGCRFSEAPAPSPDSMVVRIYKFQTPAVNAPYDEQRSRQLIGLIRQLIEPKSWVDSGASISEAPDAIVVRQTVEIQNRVEQFLQVFGASAYSPSRGIALGSSFRPAGASTVGPAPANAK